MMTLSNKRKILLVEMNWMFLCKLGFEENDMVFAQHCYNYGNCEKCNKLGESHDFH